MSAMTPEAFTVTARRRETADTWTLELERDGGGAGAFAPGQFNMLYAFGQGESAISISGDPGRDGALVHTVRAVGLTTAAICRAQPGDVLGVRGPFGNAWPVEAAEGGDVVIVAGGIGLAPLRPAICAVLAHRERYGRVVVLYGGRTPELLLYPGELDAWRARGDVDVAVTVDAAASWWRGRVGVVPALVAGAGFDAAAATAMVCGPEVMMRFAVAALRDRGVAATRIHLSMERNMQCGIGHCGLCQLGPTLVCRDGPVYSYDMLGPWLAIREL
jgi:NAD(P)H-flavin reductase